MRADRGFTLTEVLINLALVSIVASALLTMAHVQVSLHRDQGRVQAAQDNARAALETLAHDARLIGAPTRGYGLVNSTGTGAPTVPIYWVYNNYSAAGDRLDVIAPAGVLLGTTSDTGATAMQVDLSRLDPASQASPESAPFATAGLAPGDLLLLSNLPGVSAPPPPALLSPASACAGAGQIGAALLKIQSIPTPTRVNVSPVSTGGCSFPRGSLAVRAVANAYYVDTLAQLVIEPSAQLGISSGLLPVAEGIADLQIAVAVDGLNGLPRDDVLQEIGQAANDDEWAFNFPGENFPAQPPSALRITIVARTLAAPGEGGRLGPGRPRVEDHERGEPDPHRYRVLTTTVTPRNLMVTP